MRRLLIFVVLFALMMAGCTKPAPPPGEPGQGGAPAPGPVETPPGEQPPGPGGTTPGGPPASGPGELGDLATIITAAPANTFKHHRFQPGEAINQSGIFIMKTATGEVEGWTLGDDPAGYALFSVSDDNRWISAQATDQAYLLDRTTGAAYQWAQNKARLVAAWGETLLFRTDTRFWVASADLKRITPVALQEEGWAQALIAPDGQAAFLLNGQKILRLEMASGAIREVGTLDGPREYAVTWLKAQGGQVLAGADGEVRRFDWTGKELGRQSVPGTPQYSPDGRLVAWPSDLLGGVTGVTVVGTAADLSPRFRLVSVDRCADAGPTGAPWLADSSGLVVRTGGGEGWQLLGADGTLSSLKAVTGEGFWNMPAPAPDRADWFAVGGVKVVDRQGRVVAEAVPHSEGLWQGVGAGVAPWGETSDEVRFTLIGWGKDYGCLPEVMVPEVQMAPFPVITGLEVNVPAGDCVNLRMDTNLGAPVITCLPNGTRLTGSTPPGRLNKGYLQRESGLAATDMGGDGWWFVRTETGQRGWVRLSGEYLKLAAAPAGDPAPDPVADLIRDERENLLWWFSVADGETVCGPACAGTDKWEWLIWPVAEWCLKAEPGNGYAYIRKEPGFDAARHEAGVAALEASCKAFQEAWSTLGEPADTQAWRDVVAKVKAGLGQR